VESTSHKLDEDVLRAALKYLAHGKCYTYVIAADEIHLVDVNKFPTVYLQNTDPRSRNGFHWNLLMLFSHCHAEWYDSFNHRPQYYNIQLPFGLRTNFRFMNTMVHQSPNSSLCGVYGLYIFHNRIICNRNFTDIIYYDFSPYNLRRNDEMVASFYNSICCCTYKNKKRHNYQVCRPVYGH
jgi:hypothetical protein